MTARRSSTPKYHQNEEYAVEEVGYWHEAGDNQYNYYTGGRTVPVGPAPAMPAGYRLDAAQLHEVIDNLAVWAQENGFKNIYFAGFEGLSIGGNRPLTPEAREKEKKNAAKRKAANARRKETLRRRQEKAQRTKEEKERTLLRELVQQYPDEVRSLNAFED